MAVEVVDLVERRRSFSFSVVDLAYSVCHCFRLYVMYGPCLDGIHWLYPVRPPEIGSWGPGMVWRTRSFLALCPPWGR